MGNEPKTKGEEKMLAIFQNGLVDPPKELNSPAAALAPGRSKSPEEILKNFFASNPSKGFSLQFVDKAYLGHTPQSLVNANRR